MTLTDPLLCEATMAISLSHLGGYCQYTNKEAVTDKQSFAVLQHRGNFLRILIDRMKSPTDTVDDATLFAILNMIVLESTIADWDAYTTNLAGLHHLLAQRGGFEAMKWRCFFRTHLTWAHLRASAHSTSQRAFHPKGTLQRSQYHTFPFLVAIYPTASKLPAGLNDLAASGNLSVSTINLLASVYEWTQEFDPDAEECAQDREYYASGLRLISTLADILARSALTTPERMLCIGVYAYINATDGRRRTDRQPRGLRDLLVGIRGLAAQVVDFDDYLLWTAMAVANNNDDVSSTAYTRWLLLDTYMDQTHAKCRWDHVLSTVQKFFWTSALEQQWHTSWETALQRRRSRGIANSANEVPGTSSLFVQTC